MRHTFFTLATLLLLSATAAAQDTIRLAKYAGNLKQVAVRIGDSTYQLLFDTGGGETFLSPRIAAALGREVYGESTTFRMSGEPVRYQRCDSVTAFLGNMRLHFSSVGIWDLMSILPKGLPQVDGVLSLRSFEGRALTIDLGEERLIVETRETLRKRTRRMTPLESRFATGPAGNELGLFLRIRNQKRSFWFLFDSGNLRDVLLAPATARAWGLAPDSTGAVLEHVLVPLAGRTQSVRCEVAPIIYDGALNFRFIREHLFTLDLARHRAWID